MKLLIYMPALNEEQSISSVIESILKIDLSVPFSILVVNDGSSDNTARIALDSGAFVISHSRNKGVGGAFLTAVNYSIDNDIDILVSIDADNQFSSKEIKKLIKPILEENADFVLGTRFNSGKPKNMPTIKFLGNLLVNKIISRISNEKIIDASCGFRAYSRFSLLNLNLQGDFTYTHETILDLINKKNTVAQIPISVQYFKDRKSRVAGNVIDYGLKSLKIILKSYKDYAPFRFFLSIGLFFLFIGVLSFCFVSLHWFNTGEITPYKSLGVTSLFLVFCFLIFLVLALVTDILSRIRNNQEKILFLLKKNENK